MNANKTINYYNNNAESFVLGTVLVDFSEIQNEFLNRLKPGSCILDFGCGSGRDTKYFLSRGYQVEAIDGSFELCKIASNYTGIKVKQMLVQDLQEQEKYDGIWACASILHVRKNELPHVFQRMYNALKPGGIIYTSFKYGDFEGERNGRYFSDFTEKSFEKFLLTLEDFSIEKMWITGDVRTGRGKEQWLNIILRKTKIR